MKTLTLADVVPTPEAPALLGMTLDSFRGQVKKDPRAPKAFKIGQANFYRRAELLAWKRKRDAVRAT